MTHENEILTEPEAAEFLRISVSTIKRRRKKNAVPFFKEGRLVRYSRTHLLRYVEEAVVANSPVVPAPTKYRRAGHRSARNQAALLELV